MKLSFLTILLFIFSFSITAQETEIEENTLENQFDKIYRVSTSYQSYKVISKVSFQKLKSDVLDSIKTAKNIILEKDGLLKANDTNIKSLNEKINKTQLDLETSIKKENSISLFGLWLQKTTYNLILWVLIIVLLLGLLFFMYKFSNSNIITNEAKDNLIEIEQEFEQHRKKSLEKEQKLRRQLQDEINKQKN